MQHSSPAAAYRADMAKRHQPFGPDDDRWLTAAQELHLAATATGAGRAEHLAEASDVAVETLGGPAIDAFVHREWRGERCAVEALAVLADSLQWKGALHLAALMFDDVLRAAPEPSAVERGRLLALRARVAWRLGLHDDAADRYRHLAEHARRIGNPELEARAEIGLIAVAQLRGNIPDVRAHASSAAKLAERVQFPLLAMFAYQGLTFAEAKEGDYNAALLSAWKSLQLALGDAIAEAEALQILGQLMLESGYPAEARAGFAAVMTRAAPAHILLPALGGLALASARCATEATVEWSVREVWRAQALPVPRYQLAEALLECAAAFEILGRHSEAGEYRQASLRIAKLGGFHELVFRADDLSIVATAPASPAHPLDRQAARVARQVAALEPDQLPERVEFEPVMA